MTYYKERIGYRANAEKEADNLLSNGKSIKPSDGFVTVFAERRNNLVSLGEYGGDAYPLLDEYEIKLSSISGHSLGIVLVSDGVGNAGYVHPSLGRYLDTRINEYGLKEKDDLDRYKLMIFLRDLYGQEIFQEDYRSVLEYALKCFADVPAYGYFASDAEHWYDSVNFQCGMPFYKRDSQSLGSRIICVGLYKTAIEWVRKNKLKFQTELSEDKIEPLVASLKKELEDFAFGDGKLSFRDRTQQTNQSGEMMFSYDDAPNTDKKDRYFLAATVAAWFYVYEPGDARKGKKDSVYAVSLNIGDARTYLINKADGVRQISVDDAFPNNDMRGFVHRGQTPLTTKEYCDGSFFARMIKSELPCALFACSDGIYETVCNVKAPGRETLPYGDSHDAKDILFEKNLLEAMRRSYSFDDFKRELIFTFYAQPENVGRVIESCESCGIDAKRDDSGTAAVRFFGTDTGAPVEIFRELRNTATTSLDKLWQLLIDQFNAGKPIPYIEPHVTPKEQRMSAQMLQYAIGAFKSAVLDKLIAIYPQAYDSMTNASATTVWGIPQAEKWSTFQLKMIKGNMLVVILNNALKDWQEITGKRNGVVPIEWGTEKLYEHVIFDKEMWTALNNSGFGDAYEKLTADPPLTEEDLQIELYEWFQQAFYGITPVGAANPDYEYNSRTYVWKPEEALRTPEAWNDSLQKIISEFEEKVTKQAEASKPSNEAATKQAGATEQSNEAATKQAGATEQSNEAATKQAGATEQSNEAATKQAGATGQSNEAATKQAGATETGTAGAEKTSAATGAAPDNPELSAEAKPPVPNNDSNDTND